MTPVPPSRGKPSEATGWTFREQVGQSDLTARQIFNFRGLAFHFCENTKQHPLSPTHDAVAHPVWGRRTVLHFYS